MKKALNGFILFAMIASILVQYNDPDGIVWAMVYGYGAVMAFNALRDRYDVWLLVIGIVGTLVGGILLLPDSLDNWITNEVARETGGLVMTAICLAILLAQRLIAGAPEEIEDEAKPAEE